MGIFDEFKTDDQVTTLKLHKPKFHSSIIKQKDVRLNSTKMINPYENNHIPVNKGKVTPLTEGDEVIGFIYECSCGEIAKVIFDFDESLE